MSTASSGQSPADFGPSEQQDGSAPTPEALLLDELKSISRLDRNMRPATLKRHSHLLAAPEVLRRAGGSDASLEARAMAAQEALKDAVGEVVDHKDRLVARASLCMDGFEGLSVEDRITVLNRDSAFNRAGISPRQYSRRQARARENMIAFLLGELPPDPPTRAASSLRHRSELRGDPLPGLASTAALLHHAGLSCLFLRRVRRQFPVRDYLPMARLIDTNHRFLFKTYCEFLYYEPELARSASRPALARLAEATRASIHFLMRTTRTSGPLPKAAYEGDDVFWPHPHEAVRANAHYKSLYGSVWLPWYRDVIFGHPEDEPTPVHRITAKSAALVPLIDPKLALDTNIDFSPRRQAQYVLLGEEHSDIHLPDGRSLRQMVKDYFDHEGPAVASSGIAWDD